MPPPTGHVPRTPDRRTSSSALFGAFRSLTSGRLKSPTPPDMPSLGSDRRPASVAGARAASADGHVQQSPPDIVADDEKALGGPPDIVVDDEKALGGPPELGVLVAQLHGSLPLSDRALAVRKICCILEEYPVRNVLPLWAAGSHLLANEQAAEGVEAGYMLLKSCAALSDLTPVERNVLFNAIALREGDKNFDLRLQAVSILTNGGRNVEAFETSVASFILNSLDSCFKESRNAYNASRKAQGKKSVEQPAKEAENMSRLFQYVIDISRFNSKIFSEDDLELLLNKVMGICQETTQPSDIECAIKLFDTIITYVHVPKNALKACLEVLCAIHRQLADLQEQTWNTLSNLFKSHIGQAAVSSLLKTLLDGPIRKSRQYSVYRGVIQVLQLLLLEDGRNGLPIVPISLLFPALKSSIKTEHKTQESFVMGLIAAILAEEKLRDLLLSEADWSDLIYIIRTCAEREDDRETAIAAKTAAEKAVSKKTASAAGNGSHVTGNVGALSNKAASEDVEPESVSNFDSSTIGPTAYRRLSDDNFSQILCSLDGISTGMDLIQKSAVMELFMHVTKRLNDSTTENMIRFYTEQGYFHPSNSHWLEACRRLVEGVLKDATRPQSLRISTVKVLRETYNTVDGLCVGDDVLQCAALLLDNIKAEEDVTVLNALVDFAVDVADRAPDANFPDTIDLLKTRLEAPRASFHSLGTASHLRASQPLTKPGQPLGSACNVIATAFVRLFTRSVTKSARKTLLLYNILRYIAGSDLCESDARLTALKLLFRLRADSNHSLIVSASSEGETIATVLCRTAETAVVYDKLDNGTPADPARPEDQNSWREQRKVSGSSPHSSLSRHTSRHNNATGRVSKPIPPLWMYPGPKGLPEDPSTQSSRVVFAHIDDEEYPLSDDLLDLQVTLWLELVISLLQKASDWEIYSYILVHLGPQLSNQALVRSCVPQLKMLRSVACEQIRGSTFHEPPGYTLLKKADVAVCLFHILTVLISYHDEYEKSEEDELVKTFLHGIGSWDRTAKWCIHALTVCCHEIPRSVSKSLDNIIQKMSQIITKPTTAIHILEFLTSMARMPDLYKNFREDEFKMVFGVSFRYLQHVRDQRERAAAASASQPGHRSLWQSGVSRDFATASDQNSSMKAKAAADDLPQYVYSLAYHVITFWFMGLKMEDRPRQIPWITKNLIYTDSKGHQVMEEQGQVIVDMMNMVAYSDRDETIRDPNFAKETDGEVWKKTWIVGHSLMTIETGARTGVSLITSRRPCGTRYLYHRPLLAPPPRHQVPLTTGLAAEAFKTSSYIGILPDDIFQTYYAPLNLVDPPIPLPDDDMTRRAIEAFDRNATVDGHKVGVIYIGEGQMEEREILMNDIGSAAYTSFLNDLGTLVRLKGAKFNTGGLDTRNDDDGEFTFCWRDRCIELVFHITTMMPTNPEDNMTYANKKRHIGNDFVNIIFNDSGFPYNFDTFPTAFNYVYIVITPESRASFVDRRLDTDPDGKKRYYKVQVIPKPGFPDISPAAESKIISRAHLAAYCRLIAINACVFSQVWSIREGGESVSSWRNRLRELERLRTRYGARDAPTASSPSSPHNTTPGASLSSPPSKSDALTFKRTSVATFISEGTSRSSITGGSQQDIAL
ncbi:uncharacterized protein BDR25DRAFT_260641 [Lindgomyces ingoldianus]|uniref:Uncharacterized protein n=1 Tax=Lindgomyces ingoldianus TaxID=673940 RepID=A0ACB6QXL2_9PLEO|nr:uncharacterized protein BDR25DRAFT_260641 [Lindgomyces ingoldianus]KAF2471250.1 hypothetical protein BDR25DRAFT_260641 [Lindgomyces ingoldianus]